MKGIAPQRRLQRVRHLRRKFLNSAMLSSALGDRSRRKRVRRPAVICNAAGFRCASGITSTQPPNAARSRREYRMHRQAVKREVRRRRNHPAWIKSVNGSLHQCQVWDVSRGDAKLVIDEPGIAIPTSFELQFSHNDLEALPSRLAPRSRLRHSVCRLTLGDIEDWNPIFAAELSLCLSLIIPRLPT